MQTHPAVRSRAHQAARNARELLECQAAALRESRADDLAALEPGIRRAVQELAAAARTPIDASLRDELAQLQRLAASNATWLARRRNAVAGALDALVGADAGLRQHVNARVYGRQGQLQAPAWRGGFGRA